MHHKSTQYALIQRKKPARARPKQTLLLQIQRHLRIIPRAINTVLLYCAGIVPNSPHLFPEVSLRSRARGFIILISGCLNGSAWGYAALYCFHQWWLAIVVGLAMAGVVIHLDLYIVSGQINAHRKTPFHNKQVHDDRAESLPTDRDIFSHDPP
jgi:hypothetical protein